MTTRASTAYDAIVIGAGHNSLVTAGYLSKSGLRPLLGGGGGGGGGGAGTARAGARRGGADAHAHGRPAAPERRPRPRPQAPRADASRARGARLRAVTRRHRIDPVRRPGPAGRGGARPARGGPPRPPRR